MAVTPLPHLKTASLCEESIAYNTGASYKGKLEEHRRKGFGTFLWPNGAKYEGEFVDNERVGQGIQHWPDGSCYEGVFKDDVRHGQGKQTWSDNAVYTGAFVRDRRHGTGTYTWPDSSEYAGAFYINRREGYGKFTHRNGTVFEGLYRKDERFGPGSLTYADGRQDVGLWMGDKLIKILSSYDNSFSMKHHKDLEYNPQDHKTLITMADRHQNKKQVIDSIVNPPPAFKYEGSDNLRETSRCIFLDSLHPESLAMDCEIFEAEYFKHIKADREGSELVTQEEAINCTPLLIEIQKYIHRHGLSSEMSTYERGSRASFKSEPGPLEVKSLQLIEMSFLGDKSAVQDLLLSGHVSPDVADASGFTPLQAAATNCHRDIINMLLDHGADINKLHNEGLSALAQCFTYYYPVELFKENIAEREYTIKKTIGNRSRRSIDVVAVRVSRPDQYTYLYMYHYIRKFCGRFNRSDIQLLTLFSDLVVTLLHSIYPFLLPKIYDWFYTIDS